MAITRKHLNDLLKEIGESSNIPLTGKEATDRSLDHIVIIDYDKISARYELLTVNIHNGATLTAFGLEKGKTFTAAELQLLLTGISIGLRY